MAGNTERLVIDASVALAWILPDEASGSTEALFGALAKGGSAIVPSTWPAEIGNGVLNAERRKRISSEIGSGFLARLSKFPILIDALPLHELFEKALPMARFFQLTIYDAMYLELALRLTLPLATLDRDLIRAAPVAGVSLWS